MKKWVLFIGLGFILWKGTISNADQSQGCLCGQVRDAKTLEGLIGVNIRVMETSIGTTTDTEGNYRISNLPTGSYRVEYRFIGYKSVIRTDVIISPAKPTTINVEMAEEDIELQAVTVTIGYFSAEEQTPVSAYNLAREEIRRYPGGFEDVVRTVSTLPGVAINQSGGRNDLLVRGGGPSENLYIINTLEVPNINHFGNQGSSSGSLSFINLDFVEDVSFSTGGFSTRYGDKMSSVLALSLGKGRKDRIGGKALIAATQYGLNLEGPFCSRGNFIFSARQSYLDLIFKAAGLPFVPVYTDFNLVADIKLSPTDNLFIMGLGAIDRVDRDQSNSENRVTNAGIMDNTQNQWITGVNYRHLIRHGYLDVSTGANFNQYRFSQIDSSRIEYFRSRADEYEYMAKVQGYVSFSRHLGIYVGTSAKRASLDNDTHFADTIYNRSGQRIAVSDLGYGTERLMNQIVHKLAFFGEIEYQPLPAFQTVLGVRGDYYSFINQKMYGSPRALFKYNLNALWSLKASTGLYQQAPSYIWALNPVNRQLKALRNFMNILGADYLWRSDLRLSVEFYHKSYGDLPTGIQPGITDYLVITNTGTGFGGREDDFQSFGYFPLQSSGKGTAYGLELVAQKKYSDTHYYGQAALTWSRSRYTAFNGKGYPGQYDQRFIFNLSGGYRLNADWEFSSKFRLFTGIPYTPVYVPNSETQYQIQKLPEEYLSRRLGTAHHLDIRVDRYFNFQRWKLTAFVDIQNLYNYKIPTRPNYDFWEKTISTANAIGVLPSIGISAEF